MWQYIIIVVILIVTLLAEVIFSPRIEITRKRDWLLFYNLNPLTRDYIKLFRL